MFLLYSSFGQEMNSGRTFYFYFYFLFPKLKYRIKKKGRKQTNNHPTLIIKMKNHVYKKTNIEYIIHTDIEHEPSTLAEC